MRLYLAAILATYAVSSMADIVGSFSALQRVPVPANIGEYAVNRTINGQNMVFLIYFLKGSDGVWRIDAM